jgi:hypothetical protein
MDGSVNGSIGATRAERLDGTGQRASMSLRRSEAHLMYRLLLATATGDLARVRECGGDPMLHGLLKKALTMRNTSDGMRRADGPHRHWLTAPDAEVDAWLLKEIGDGKWSRKRMREAVQATGGSWNQLEGRLRHLQMTGVVTRDPVTSRLQLAKVA